VPVEASVALILRPMIPALPIPLTMHDPGQ
jgi:hypothetical protein